METTTALWRRLDVPGHDACRLDVSESGFSLAGTAVFLHESRPACLEYAVDCDRAWRTIGGLVRGFIAGAAYEARIGRDADGWSINGRRAEGLDELVDLDLGFTPATNLIQTSRVRLLEGKPVDMPAAWLDAGAERLVRLERLEQRYTRCGANRIWYEAPDIPYEAMLEIGPDGFVRHYPGLWMREA